ncbi:replication protein RepB [Nocardia sp. NPDC058499]|uniref:replication protein RepB n=1 Tax=Nocardia sp. NPDC058499 TaxID=3346530 RepID=UPI0036593098
MTAKTPLRRAKTAKELAAKHGCSDRTIRRMIAEPREVFEGRAASLSEQARELRAGGAKYKEIATQLGVSIGSVSRLLHGLYPSQTTKKAS